MTGSALIGSTGFVGGTLARQRAFTDGFNSKNFQDMRGRHFDEMVCAGVAAVKWKANREPEADRAGIAALEDVLRTVTAEKFILISTIDVYPQTVGADELTALGGIPNHAYGAHRLAFEDFCAARFPKCFIVRLPALFGAGLRKNILFDLLNDNCLEMINPDSSFQYYDLRELTRDIELAVRQDVRFLNLFTEPVATREILTRFFPDKAVGAKPGAEAHYDLGTVHAALWARTGRYCRDKATVLTQMEAFVRDERARRGGA